MVVVDSQVLCKALMNGLGTLAAGPGLLRVQSSGGYHRHCLAEALPEAVVSAWVHDGAKSDHKNTHKSTESSASGLSLTLIKQNNGFHFAVTRNRTPRISLEILSLPLQCPSAEAVLKEIPQETSCAAQH